MTRTIEKTLVESPATMERAFSVGFIERRRRTRNWILHYSLDDVMCDASQQNLYWWTMAKTGEMNANISGNEAHTRLRLKQSLEDLGPHRKLHQLLLVSVTARFSCNRSERYCSRMEIDGKDTRLENCTFLPCCSVDDESQLKQSIILPV